MVLGRNYCLVPIKNKNKKVNKTLTLYETMSSPATFVSSQEIVLR